LDEEGNTDLPGVFAVEEDNGRRGGICVEGVEEDLGE